jgi:hypothetical protein
VNTDPKFTQPGGVQLPLKELATKLISLRESDNDDEALTIAELDWSWHASPEVILSLIAENESLKAQLAELGKDNAAWKLADKLNAEESREWFMRAGKAEAELARLQSPKWVDCKQELPPYEKRVLILRRFHGKTVMEFARYFDKQDFPWVDDFGGCNGPSVTHWTIIDPPAPPEAMPKPENREER